MCLDQTDCYCKEGEPEMDALLEKVAEQAYPAVIKAYSDLLSEVPEDIENKEEWLGDEGLYLYVYEGGEWLIDSPSYLQDHRNIIATAGVYDYVNADTLSYALEESTF